MEIRPSDKQLVAVLGIAVGAGIALTISKRGVNRKERILATTDPKWMRTTVSISLNSLRAEGLNSRTIREDREARIPPSAGAGTVSRASTQPETPEDVQVPGESRPVPCSTVEQSIFAAATVLEMTRRLGGRVLDASIIFVACCLFGGISQAFRASAPIGRLEVVVLTWSVVLIAVFYAFLFKMGGGETPGQAWQKRRRERAQGDANQTA
jgi:hypothetical protein